MFRSHPRDEKGFTLVELAIVLMIIGLLIGGILRGQELMTNAQVNATIRQVHAYQGAIVTFQDTFGQLPGDMSVATRRVPNCTAQSHCGNGDGNSIVGRRLPHANSHIIQTGTAVPGIETTYFWKHLSAAHLIAGVNPASNPANPEFAETHPTAKISGVFMIGYGMHVPRAEEGLILVLSNTLTAPHAIQGLGNDPLTPREAYLIDSKMDDGLPDTGSVSAPDNNNTCDNGLQYNLNNSLSDRKGCILIFKM